MKLPDFSEPTRVPAIERAPSSLIATRHFYHFLAGPDGHSLDSLETIAVELTHSPSCADQLDAGWAFAEAALATESQSSAIQYLQQARTQWRQVRDGAPFANLYVQARFYEAYLKSFGELVTGQAVDGVGLLKRLGKVNKVIAKLVRHPIPHQASDLRGLAPEVATATLATRYHQSRTGHVGWPATPWQDKGPVSMHNYDVQIGSHLHGAPEKIQVKAFLDTASYDSASGHKEDGELQLRRAQRKYDDTYALIFGDVHLGNSPNNPFRANQLLARLGKSAFQQSIDVIMHNVIDEVHTTQRATA